MVTLDVICFVWICMKKGSKCNHQSSHDWNDLEVVYASASRIEPNGKGMFQDCFISILYVTALIPTCEIPGFVLKLKVFRSKDPKILTEDLEHKLIVPWFIFGSLSPLSPGKVQFISQIVKIAHKIWNCIYITSILSFHYFIRFWAIVDLSYLDQYKRFIRQG